MPEHYVRLISLPIKVEGVTLPNDDGSFDIYINSRLSPQRRQKVLEHELRHIQNDHFYLDMPVSTMEKQADGQCVDLVLHPPCGKLALFSSPQALADWFKSLAAQCRSF